MENYVNSFPSGKDPFKMLYVWIPSSNYIVLGRRFKSCLRNQSRPLKRKALRVFACQENGGNRGESRLFDVYVYNKWAEVTLYNVCTQQIELTGQEDMVAGRI